MNSSSTASIGIYWSLVPLKFHVIIHIENQVFDFVCKDKKLITSILKPQQGIVRKRKLTPYLINKYKWFPIVVSKEKIATLHQAYQNPPMYSLLGYCYGKNCITFCFDVLK